jgi:uncharacterized membrane protein
LVYCLGMASMGYVEYLGWVISVLISAGYVACLIQLRKGSTFDFQDFLWAFQNFNRLIHVLLASVFRSVIIVVGLILLIVPGIYWSVTTSLSDILIVKENLDSVGAIKRSMQLTKGHWNYMAGLLFVLMFLNLVGILCFFVGVFVTIPLSFHVLLNVTDALAARVSPTPTANGTESSFIQVNPS